ncbi:I20L2 protein, partial [Rhinopomastus cyanomelas]|nr:I20L2 protein [Rhinopomastus cyanomelas]
MADLILNVDFAPSERPRKAKTSNRRHQSFVRRRRLLERRGVLRQKQLPLPPPREQPRDSRGKKRHGNGKGPQRPPNPKANGNPNRHPKAKGAPRGPQPGPKENGAPWWGPRAKGIPRPPPDSKANGTSRVTRPDLRSGPGPEASEPPSTLKARGAARRPQRAAGAPPSPPQLVAIDCEMVGTGPGGRTSALARCSIVGYDGQVLYDRFVRPEAPVVDFRTRWSGIRRHHMASAVPFASAQRQILRILSGKVVVGHSIHNDFKALKYFHPKALTRDTSRISLLNQRGGFPEGVAVSLKRLTKQLLHRDIQVGNSGHSSVEDAQATMDLYKVVETEWEQHLLQNP